MAPSTSPSVFSPGSIAPSCLARREFEAGQFLFRAGDAGDTLYVLARGSVSIKLPVKGGGESKRLVALSPGVMFGEKVLIESRPRSADAVADEFAVAYGLKRAAFESLRIEQPALAGKLMHNVTRLLLDRLRTTTEELRAAAAQRKCRFSSALKMALGAVIVASPRREAHG